MKKQDRKGSDIEYIAWQLGSLTELLIERGVITRQDLRRMMRVVDLDDDSIDEGLDVRVLRRTTKGTSRK